MTEPTRDDDAAFDSALQTALEAVDEQPPATVRAAILAQARLVAARNARAAPDSVTDDVEGVAAPAFTTPLVNDPRWHVAALAAAAIVAALIAWPLLDSSQRATLATQNGRLPAAGTPLAAQEPPAAQRQREAPAAKFAAAEADHVAGAAIPPATPPALPPAAEAPKAQTPTPVPALAAPAAPAAAPTASALARVSQPRMQAAQEVSAAGPGAADSASGAPARSAGVTSSSALLLDAVLAEDADRVRQLLRVGSDVNAADPAGRTALLLATEGHSSQLVTLLLEHGADPNIGAPSGETPLRLAKRKHFDDLVAILVAKGARD